MFTRFRPHAGVALIEALIALAIMAFGMLAVVGMQATLRQNSDLSRQRAEAVRIAQAEIESVRAYSLLVDPTGTNPTTFSTIATRSDVVTQAGNATYTLNSRVVEGSGIPSLAANQPSLKTISVTVSWTDRNNVTQNVGLSTAIHGVAPELAGTLSVPPNGFPTAMANRRNGAIPWDSLIPLGDGKSAFIPPQAVGGTVIWRFDNVSGVIEICALTDPRLALTNANLTCSGRAQLLTGFVNFASDASTQATANNALVPVGTRFPVEVQVQRTSPSALLVDSSNGCFTEQGAAEGPSYVVYFCAVPVSQVAGQAPAWSGYAFVTSSLLPVTPVLGGFSTCRYTHPDARAPEVKVIPNVQHPRVYSNVKGPLAGQNFLIVRVVNGDDSDCPDGPPLPRTSTTYPQPQTPP
jgi:Tfp pilus assembly protein PilX